MQFVQNIEYQTQCHADNAGKYHTCKFYISQIQGDSGKTYDKYHRSQCQVSGFAVIYFVIYQHTQSGSTDHTVKQERNSSDDRSRNGIDQCCQFSKERTADRKDCRPANYLYTVNFVIAITPMFSP